MGLLIIVLSGISGALFTLGYKIKEQRGHRLELFMFLFSASFLLFAFLFSLIYGHGLFNTYAMIIGIPNGFSMYISVIMYSRAIRRARLSISWTVVQFCILIPFLASIVFFETRVSTLSIIGTALMLVSIVIFGKGKREKTSSDDTSLELRTGIELFAASLFSGIALTMPLVYVSLADNASPFTLLFFSSAVMAAASLIRLGKAVLTHLPSRSEIVVPIFMSFMQVISLSLLITGLKTIPGSAAYPLKSIIGLLCIYACSYLCFKERMIPIEIVGIVCSVTAIVFITMTLH